MEANLSNQKEEKWWQIGMRNSIAIVITVFVVGITLAVAIISLIKADIKVSLDYIGQTLLPLWGTWLGTVLAFYFGKANFEAATNAITRNSSESKMANLSVGDVMIPLRDIKYLDYDKREKDSIETILADKDFEPYNRFAVFDSKKIVKAMIHRGSFYEFMHKKKDVQRELTLKDILETDDVCLKNTLSYGFGFVKVNSTVLDAKKVIDSVAECQNVFITQNGGRNEPVLGLLTNNKILELMRS